MRRSSGQSGFTLVETLVALLIVVMVSVIVATGVPAGIKAYRSAVAASNAEISLSTLAQALRDELGSATEATSASGDVVSEFVVGIYRCGEGYYATIQNASAKHCGPVKSVSKQTGLTKGDSWAIVPDAIFTASSDDLHAEFDRITFDPVKRVFKVHGLRVYEVENGSEQELARIDEDGSDCLAVRAPYCKAVLTASE